MTNRTRMLDVEVIYQLYLKHPTLGGVSEALAKQGVINPRTERPYTRMSILGALRLHPEYRKLMAQRARRVGQVQSKMTKLRETLSA